jgi:hypothetical protein
MDTALYAIIRIYLLILGLFFLGMYIQRTDYYRNRFVFHGATVFLPILLYAIRVLYLRED